MALKIFTDFPNVKILGDCFGAQLFAHVLGGKTQKMVLGPDRPLILGRELIKLTDAFFDLPYVKKYMKDNNLTKDIFPALVLQQSHGDEVMKLPPGAVLLGYSDSCDIEMFGIGTRLIVFQPHPDFNCGFQQEINE